MLRALHWPRVLHNYINYNELYMPLGWPRRPLDRRGNPS